MATKKTTPGTEMAIILPPNGGDVSEITPHKEVLTVQQIIDRETAKFDIPRQAIAALKKKYGALTIAGVDDKKGYEAVDAARKDVKAKAVATDKLREKLKADYIAIGKGIEKFAGDIYDPLRAIQSDLTQKMKVIDDEKERIEQEKQEAADRELNDRINKLEAVGLVFKGSYYCIGDTISMGVQAIGDMQPAEFDTFLSRVSAENDRLLQIEIDRKETERLEQEKRDNEKKELDEQKRQQQIAQDNIDRQLKEIEEHKAEIKRQESIRRAQIMVLAGLLPTMRNNVPLYILDTQSGRVEITESDIKELAPAEWDTRAQSIQTLALEINSKEQTRLKAVNELNERTATRSGQLTGAGFIKMAGGFRFTNQITNESFTVLTGEIETFTPGQFESTLATFNTFVKTQTAAADDILLKRKQAAETLRLAGLNDFERIQEYVAAFRQVLNNESPTLERKDTTDTLAVFNSALRDLLADLENAGESLTK
jgi:hypothetical protein